MRHGASATAPPETPRGVILDRARALADALRSRVALADELRRLPDATHRDFVAAGLYRLYQPRRFGGLAADYQLQIDVGAEIGRACGSSAWVLIILASHSWVHGMLPPEAQQEVWDADPDDIIASASPTRGARMERIPGGARVHGTWSFASGVDHCGWTHLNLLLPDAAGAPRHHFAAVPASDYRILDDWDPVAMRGTGSKSILLDDIVIPAHRLLDTQACIGGPTPGSHWHADPLFRMPLFALFGHGIAAPAIGMALGALDAVANPLRAARRSQAGVLVGDQQSVRIRLAEAAAEIDAARALLQAASDGATALALADRLPSLEERVRWRRNAAYAATLCLRAVQRLQPLAGAHGLRAESPFHRAYRDLQGCCAHIALTWDVQAANYGGVMLGDASTDPKL